MIQNLGTKMIAHIPPYPKMMAKEYAVYAAVAEMFPRMEKRETPKAKQIVRLYVETEMYLHSLKSWGRERILNETKAPKISMMATQPRITISKA
jgi:hypothetical protein